MNEINPVVCTFESKHRWSTRDVVDVLGDSDGRMIFDKIPTEWKDVQPMYPLGGIMK